VKCQQVGPPRIQLKPKSLSSSSLRAEGKNRISRHNTTIGGGVGRCRAEIYNPIFINKTLCFAARNAAKKYGERVRVLIILSPPCRLMHRCLSKPLAFNASRQVALFARGDLISPLSLRSISIRLGTKNSTRHCVITSSVFLVI
jgi:hypothetical protein